MNWISRLERKLGRFAVPNLMTYLIILYTAGFLMMYINPSFYYQYLALDPKAVMSGQIWRLVTFIIMPPDTSVLYFALYMYLYYVIGTQLERSWGTFTFDLYIVLGILGHIAGAMLIYFLTGYNGSPYYYSLRYLYMSLFLGFALTYPEAEFLLFFIVPIKAKYFAIFEAIYYLYYIVTGGMATRIMILLSLANFIIFFVTMYRERMKRAGVHAARNIQFQSRVRQAQAQARQGSPRHRCAVCGRTELDSPNLEFRYCSQCDGAYEYCSDHLFTHIHVKRNPHGPGNGQG